MKRNILLFLILFLVQQLYSQASPGDSIPSTMGKWKLTFAEEFNDSVLNKSEWFTYYPYTNDGSDSCEFCRTHGNENQIYLDDNVVIKDGVLQLIAKQEQSTWMGEERPFTSGMIQSKRYFGMGYYEFRARLPIGKGLWPALWTFGKYSAEIDFMEAGMRKPRIFHISVHNWDIKTMEYKRVRSKTRLSEDFHTYAMEWDTNYLRFYFDGREVWTLCKYTNSLGGNPRECDNTPSRNAKIQAVFPKLKERLNVLVNLTIDKEILLPVKRSEIKAEFPLQMEIDYIRVYSD